MNNNYHNESSIHHYKGSPNGSSGKDNSAWKKFIRAILPWIGRKWDLGNAYYEARAEKEVNEAEKVKFETEKLKAETELIKLQAEKQMLEIVDIAAKQDVLNNQNHNEIEISNEEIEQELNNIVEKARLLYLKYGLRISINVQQEKVSFLRPQTKKLSEIIPKNPNSVIESDLKTLDDLDDPQLLKRKYINVKEL